MNADELIRRMERLVSASKVAMLTTIDDKGFPRSRWMTPTLLKGRPGFIYAVTSPKSEKATQIGKNAKVEWTFQSTVLDEILSAVGATTLVDDPQFKAEVLEAIGPNLSIFWRVNPDSRNLIVVETAISEITCFFPMRNERHRSDVG